MEHSYADLEEGACVCKHTHTQAYTNTHAHTIAQSPKNNYVYFIDVNLESLLNQDKNSKINK